MATERDDLKVEPAISGKYPIIQEYLQEELKGLPLLTILTIISLGMRAIYFLWQCRMARPLLRRLARTNAPIARTYLRHKVYIPLLRNGVPEADADLAIEALRVAFVEGKFDGG